MTIRSAHAGRGFTLVELLVVIGIIAVLMGILFPTITRIQASAKLVACQANLRSILQAHFIYATEFRDQKPPLWQRKTNTIQTDQVSPDIRWNGKAAVGQGILVEHKLLPLRTLMCPAAEMVDDVVRDTANWTNLSLIRSGSSYVYSYRWLDTTVAPQNFCIGITYTTCARRGDRVMAMDISADEGNTLVGEYSGRRWIAHRLLNRVNLACTDGSVRQAPASEIRMKAPFGAADEVQWFADASKYTQ